MRRNKTWTEEETNYLIEHWGETKSIQVLASTMHRTVEGIAKRARKLGLGPYLYATDSMTYGEFASAFGLYESYNWYKEKLIKAGLPVFNKQIRTKKVTKVRFKVFWQWAEKNKGMLNWAKLEKNALGKEPAWVDEQRRMDYKNKPDHTKKWTKEEHTNLVHYLEKGYSIEEIAKRLNRTASAIERRCYDYYLQRPKVAEKRSWSQEEIDEVMELRNQGWNFRNIADKTGRSERSIRGKIHDVNKRLKGDKWTVYCKKKSAASCVAL